MRPVTLPHHRTCGFPHPAVGTCGVRLPLDPMASESRNGEGWRLRAQCAGSLSRPSARLRGNSPPPSAAAPSGPVGVAVSLFLLVYATVARSTLEYAVESIPPVGRSGGDPRSVGRYWPTYTWMHWIDISPALTVEISPGKVQNLSPRAAWLYRRRLV